MTQDALEDLREQIANLTGEIEMNDAVANAALTAMRNVAIHTAELLKKRRQLQNVLNHEENLLLADSMIRTHSIRASMRHFEPMPIGSLIFDEAGNIKDPESI